MRSFDQLAGVEIAVVVVHAIVGDQVASVGETSEHGTSKWGKDIHGQVAGEVGRAVGVVVCDSERDLVSVLADFKDSLCDSNCRVEASA